MIQVEGVPESLTREQYLSLIRSVGFDPRELKSLEFRMEGIYATVRTNRIEMAPDEPDVEATHRVYIPVKD